MIDSTMTEEDIMQDVTVSDPSRFDTLLSDEVVMQWLMDLEKDNVEARDDNDADASGRRDYHA